MNKIRQCALYLQHAQATTIKHAANIHATAAITTTYLNPQRQSQRLNPHYPAMMSNPINTHTATNTACNVNVEHDISYTANNNQHDINAPSDDNLADDNIVNDIYEHDMDNHDTCITFTVEQQAMLELIKLLDNFNAPDYATEHIIKWARKAFLAGFTFQPKSMSRNTNIKWMYQMVANADHFLPYPRTVTPHVGTPFEVICYDFVPQLLSVLQDTTLMQPDNLCIDPDSPCAMYRPTNGWLGECHSGTMYQDMYKRLIDNPDKQLLCPIIAYIDKTQLNEGSRFTLEPFLFTSSIFTEKARRSHKFWRLFGYVHDCVSSSAYKQSTLKPGDSLRIYHQQLQVLLETYATSATRLTDVTLPIGSTGSMVVDIICPLMYVICDNEEADKLANHYNCRTAGICKPSRCCNVPYNELDNPSYQCQYTMWHDVRNVALYGTNDERRSLSVHHVHNAFDSIDIGDQHRGILGCLLPDTLHVLCKGPAERIMDLTFDNLTQRQKARLDDMAKMFHHTHQQTARKYYPSTDFSRGISQLTRLTANENIGAIFLLVILSHFEEGWQILQSAMTRNSQTANVKDVIELMEAMLCCHAWLKQDQLWPLHAQDEYAAYADASIRQLIHMLTTKMPRNTGNNWKIIKLHYMLHYVDAAKRYGAPRNWDAERPEHFHIHVAKQFGRRAHQCRATFERSTAQRLADAHVIDMLSNMIASHDDNDDDQSDDMSHHASVATDNHVECRGTTCIVTRHDTLRHISVVWYSNSDANMLKLPDGVAKFVLKSFNCHTVTIKTEIKYGDIIARCHPWYVDTAPRYDWIRVICNRNQLRPCKLLAVVPQHDNDLDNTYLVVQCAKHRTGIKSTLFTEWEMDNQLMLVMPDQITSLCLVLLLDEDRKYPLIAECLDHDEWHKSFTHYYDPNNP